MSNTNIFAHPQQEDILEARSRLVAVLNNSRQMDEVIQKTAANYPNSLAAEAYQNLSAQNTPLTEIDMVRQFMETYVNEADKLNAEEKELKEALDRAIKQRNLLIGLGIAAVVIIIIIILASL